MDQADLSSRRGRRVRQCSIAREANPIDITENAKIKRHRSHSRHREGRMDAHKEDLVKRNGFILVTGKRAIGRYYMDSGDRNRRGIEDDDLRDSDKWEVEKYGARTGEDILFARQTSMNEGRGWDERMEDVG